MIWCMWFTKNVVHSILDINFLRQAASHTVVFVLLMLYHVVSITGLA